MHLRINGTTRKRARTQARRGAVAASVTLALAAGVIPAMAAEPGPNKPSTVWGKDGAKAEMPPVKVGTTKAPESIRAKAPTAEIARWLAAQKKRAQAATDDPQRAAGELAAVVPKGQGQVPWHLISDVRVTDSLVARVNYSTGNLMLAATDFQISGVSQSLQLSRTYNSMDAPWGKVSQRWWQGYERYLQIETDKWCSTTPPVARSPSPRRPTAPSPPPRATAWT